MHEPVFLERVDGVGLVVFVHGFLGSPRQFSRLAQRAFSQGYSVASLLLPGHGGSAKDFSTVTVDDWQSHVDDEVGRYAGRYETIHLVGHSMGGLLGINVATKYASVSSLFLIACPFRLEVFSMQSLQTRLKQVFYPARHPMKAAYLAGSSLPPTPSLAFHGVKPAAEFRKLIPIARANLPGIRIPVTAVYSMADEIVSMKSLAVLEAGLSQSAFRSVTLSDSLHAYYPEPEQLILESCLVDSLSG